ncbi:MAG TPA: ABC transporter permease [Vicinamibacteria bacterium]|nr:ABC transporter permease [Vicinamibacteria bacterium]
MRDTDRPVPFLASARAVFGLSLEGMLWSRRSLVLGALLAIPVLIAIVYRVVLAAKMPAEITGLHLYGYLVALFWVRNALPLAALFYATALIADEVEGRTLTYLVTRPVRRSAILAGKFAAYLVTTLSLALPAAVVTFFILATSRGVSLAASVPDLFRDLGVLALTLLVYGALFALMGVLMKRPLLPGLLFLFVWEMAANLPGYVPRFTITAWLRSLVTHRPAGRGVSELFQQVLPADLGLAVLTALTAVFLWLAIWIFSSREYVLDQ